MKHMDRELQEKIETACWIGKSLFERNKVSGSSANMSFSHDGDIYITTSGSCFGTLTEGSFVSLHELEGKRKPSKEFPLHRDLYEKKLDVGAVIHTHSFYSTLWSCLEHSNITDLVPSHTPYLRMRVGSIGLIPYAKPGSEALFQLFAQRIAHSDGYLLQNHGPVIAGKTLLEAFYGLEELEESLKIAWFLRNEEKIKIRCSEY